MTGNLEHRDSIREVCLRIASGGLALAVALVLVTLLAPLTHAQTLIVLYSFTGGSDGAFPQAALIRDSAGNLYGTTEMGGDLSCPTVGCGTVFKLETTGALIVLYAFAGLDGALPRAALIHGPNGNFYSTTWQGGAAGFGTAFRVDATGKETVLHNFTGMGPDGGLLLAGLTRDAAGNFYGTASATIRQPGRWGTLFKVDPSGKGTILHTFTGKPDGAIPVAGLIRDASGNLYGTTYFGGSAGKGTVFKLDTASNETVLYSFTGNNGDGAQPYSGLIRDASGNLYGTTYFGGLAGKGTVFKLDTAGKLTVLHSFTDRPDGASPVASLVMDASGNLYGTTGYGGATGKGTVFKLDTAGKLTVLHSFAGGLDGENPAANLIMDAKGNLYGTTLAGGPGTQCGVTNGCGTVFKLSP
jgi:uncharacterized repeat protein (TIGR03803 family)